MSVARTRVPVVPLVVVGLLLAAGAAGAALLGGDDAEPEPEGPAEAVGEYFEAFADGDCDRMFSLVSDDAWPDDETRTDALAECRAQYEDQPDALDGFRVEDIEVVEREGDTATVSVRISGLGGTAGTDGEGGEGGAPAPLELVVVHEDEGWRLPVEPSGG